jgi:opacity protein-like surface antigen
MSYKQTLAIATFCGLAWATGPATAQESVAPASPTLTDSGFYGGVVLRQGPQEGPGVQIGNLASVWTKFVAPTAVETAPRTLLFGGYRWANDLALEAAISALDRYALAPGGRGGVGLALASPNNGIAPQNWNADVYTSWAFRKSFALYGRLGYAQSDSQLAYGPGSFLSTDPRRTRDGMNYGVGLRYDVTRALGVRVEYARFSRFAGESVNGLLPESDQLQFGMQFRF